MPFDTAETGFAVANSRPNCSMCPAARACLIQGACQADVSNWNAIVQNYVSVASAGKALVNAGETAGTLYVVRAGCLKSCTVDADGQERVRAFHLPGDVVGLDSLGSDRFPCNVIAVVPSQVCKLSREQVLTLLSKSPVLMQKLFDRTGRELNNALTLAGDFTADQRVAAFLLALQQRLGTLNGVLRLPMPRRDIANYLRLATETVCRVLTRFEAKGWIVSNDKKVTLKREESLRKTSMSPEALAA